MLWFPEGSVSSFVGQYWLELGKQLVASYCIHFAFTVFWRFGSSLSTSCKHWSVLLAVPAKHSCYAHLSVIKGWVIRILRSWFCSLIGLLEWSLCLFAGHEKRSLKCFLKQGIGFLWVWICILSPVLILVRARTSFSFKVLRGERNKFNYCIVLHLVQGSLPCKAVQNADGLAVPCSVVMVCIWGLQGFALDSSLAIIRNAFCIFGRPNASVNHFSSIEINKLCCVHIYCVERALPCWSHPSRTTLRLTVCLLAVGRGDDQIVPGIIQGSVWEILVAVLQYENVLGKIWALVGLTTYLTELEMEEDVLVIVTPRVGSVVHLPVGSLVLHQKCHGQQKPSSGLPNSLVVQFCSEALMDQLCTRRLYVWSGIICLHVFILGLCSY